MAAASVIPKEIFPSLYAIMRSHGFSSEMPTVAQAAEHYNVSVTTEWRKRKLLEEHLANFNKAPTVAEDTKATKKLALAEELIGFLLNKSGGREKNNERNSYSPWLKEILIKQVENGACHKDLSELTGISIDTLKHFKGSSKPLKKESVSETHQLIADIWAKARDHQRKTLDKFWRHLGRHYPDIKVSFGEVRQILIDLGLRNPRGPKCRNNGTQVKRPFEPHSIWEGDAKVMKIFINYQMFKFSWYAFCDQNTTLIVGSNIAKAESSDNFLSALKDSKDKTGIYSVGILIDNRLDDKDMGVIDTFCKENNIILLRTFPGNSKSNGYIENNFSIFEKYVGDIHVTGNNPAEIAASFAVVIAEIFTQQRNHSPRKRHGGGSPAEVAENARRPEHVKSSLEKLKYRFDKEINDSELKWALIALARAHFGFLSEESENKIKKLLLKYSISDIIAAQASYLAQVKSRPHNQYKSEYFFAILRNKCEAKGKAVYTETFRAGIALLKPFKADFDITEDQLADMIIETLIELNEAPTPNDEMLQLDALTLWLAKYSHEASLPQLWTKVEKRAQMSIALSLKRWSQVCEYLYDRLGEIHYKPLE